MKRNTTLTLIMMLSSVAAAVAAPEAPPHQTAADCLEPRQIAAVMKQDITPAQRSSVTAVAAVGQRDTAKSEACVVDVTAPYRRLHHGGMKLPSTCADAT